MNRMLPDDYKPDFILRGLFLRGLPNNFLSNVLRVKVSDPRALALKADELYQSRVSSFFVNLLSEVLEDSLQVNAVSARAHPPKAPLPRRSSSPALSSRSPTVGSIKSMDVLSDREFLVNSGASISVFPVPKSSTDNGV